jgi:hypothetical protein
MNKGKGKEDSSRFVEFKATRKKKPDVGYECKCNGIACGIRLVLAFLFSTRKKEIEIAGVTKKAKEKKLDWQRG